MATIPHLTQPNFRLEVVGFLSNFPRESQHFSYLVFPYDIRTSNTSAIGLVLADHIGKYTRQEPIGTAYSSNREVRSGRGSWYGS